MKFLKTNPWALIFIIALIFTYSCGGGGDDPNPGPDPTAVARISTAILEDVFNNGNASDIRIKFPKVANDNNIQEYRVFLVKDENAKINTFNLSTAESLGANAYQVIAKGADILESTLSPGQIDSDGDLIVAGGSYVAFVMSFAIPSDENLNNLSLPSNNVTLEETTVKITYAGNMGLIISDAEHQVAIDAMHANIGGWFPISQTDLTAIQNADFPWSETDVVMTTHAHGDHYSPGAINSLLSRQANSLYIGPSSTRGSISRPAHQVSDVSPAIGESITVTHNGLDIEVLRLIHFNQFGNNFSGVESYAFLVELGGKKILHLGDFLYTPENLDPFNFKDRGIDIVVIPTFNTLISEVNRDLIQSEIAPDQIIAIHLQTTTPISSVSAIYPEATIFTIALDNIKF